MGETRESDEESPCPPASALWLEDPLSIASLREGGAEVARAAATVRRASWCGCASVEVLFDVVEDDSPRVNDVPGVDEEVLAIASGRGAAAQLGRAVRLITCGEGPIH